MKHSPSSPSNPISPQNPHANPTPTPPKKRIVECRQKVMVYPQPHKPTAISKRKWNMTPPAASSPPLYQTELTSHHQRQLEGAAGFPEEGQAKLRSSLGVLSTWKIVIIAWVYPKIWMDSLEAIVIVQSPDRAESLVRMSVVDWTQSSFGWEKRKGREVFSGGGFVGLALGIWRGRLGRFGVSVVGCCLHSSKREPQVSRG